MFPSFVPEKARPLAARPHLIPSIFVVCLAGSVLPPGLLNTLSIGTIALYLSAQIPKATAGKVPSDYMLPIQAIIFITQVSNLSLCSISRAPYLIGREHETCSRLSPGSLLLEETNC
jgi:hypothetical protein